jgi:O-antigen/teichoic acid export membrane protein
MSTDLRDTVKSAVIWRSGSQALAQLVAWGSTLAVIRILDPSDYGIFAMTQVVMALLSFLGGYGFASSLIQDRAINERKIRQAFGMLLLVNAATALVQLALAPLAAAYYRTPLVTELLALQALIILSTPFIALPEVLLTREMDFKRPAIVNLVATVISACVALGCALSGLGVWTLVFAPLSAFWTRAIGLMIAARFKYLPSFHFSGAGGMFNFGLLLLGSHFLWTVITQADVFIAGRYLEPRELGLYAEALFLTQIIATKFVPALNSVAFPAYAGLQDDLSALSFSFLKAVRLIMLVTCPLYFGLATVAPSAVEVILGQKWLAMAPLVSILALSMPAFTLHILFAPAINAIGHPRVTLRASLFGAAIMPPAFLAGMQWGVTGLAWTWVVAFPLLPLFTFLQSRRLLGIDAVQLLEAIGPGICASAAMAGIVVTADIALPPATGLERLVALIGTGVLSYTGLVYLFSRETLFELIRLMVRRKPPEPRPAG